ncbi:MAG: FAD-dependent oxidoreductase [Candidatus Thermoplasmatota archaeon]|nr:FAD-dependent oxidoreductase [Candidatus Thermoplasmatota archaeon]
MEEYDLVIIGAGAAGLSAAIYAGRGGLKSVVLDSKMIGGQTILSPSIENYPGFPSISGPDLMDAFKSHASKYAELKEWTPVNSIKPEKDGFRLETGEGEMFAKKILLSTGAEHRKLGVPGEDKLSGRGVSYCATCDGFFFKGKRVLVVGGGNTALTEAIYLLDSGVDVTLAHRRDRLRAEKSLEELYIKKGGKILWDSIIASLNGEEKLHSVTIKNVKTGDEKEIEADGVFVAVGITPQNQLAAALGVKMNPEGYIITDEKRATNIPGIYAAGDNCAGLRQIVTGAANGAIAAVEVHNSITHGEWGQ